MLLLYYYRSLVIRLIKLRLYIYTLTYGRRFFIFYRSSGGGLLFLYILLERWNWIHIPSPWEFRFQERSLCRPCEYNYYCEYIIRDLSVIIHVLSSGFTSTTWRNLQNDIIIIHVFRYECFQLLPDLFTCGFTSWLLVWRILEWFMDTV